MRRRAAARRQPPPQRSCPCWSGRPPSERWRERTLLALLSRWVLLALLARIRGSLALRLCEQLVPAAAVVISGHLSRGELRVQLPQLVLPGHPGTPFRMGYPGG